MQVVSGRLDQPNVHFEAPPLGQLEADLDAFITWFNQPPQGLDWLVRAGITHLLLITLHPFDDGNGRVTRAVTDRALAQAERQCPVLFLERGHHGAPPRLLRSS
ncbi:Fic family protein [Halomonas sp. ISL-56]|uniref:Fic family protein n=1 Tax=Halomonas sp. ISL-56 TaxID=2819149 RepID=UPI00203662B2|nr:Fic family protein [Halomonas sp. ISL-56]